MVMNWLMWGGITAFTAGLIIAPIMIMLANNDRAPASPAIWAASPKLSSVDQPHRNRRRRHRDLRITHDRANPTRTQTYRQQGEHVDGSRRHTTARCPRHGSHSIFASRARPTQRPQQPPLKGKQATAHKAVHRQSLYPTEDQPTGKSSPSQMDYPYPKTLTMGHTSPPAP